MSVCAVEEAAAHWARLDYPVPQATNLFDHFIDTVTPAKMGPTEIRKFVDAYQKTLKLTVDALVERSTRPGSKRGMTTGLTALEILNRDRTEASERPHRFGRFGVGIWTQLCVVMGRKARLTLRDTRYLLISLTFKVWL